jgi:hypothetical protein
MCVYNCYPLNEIHAQACSKRNTPSFKISNELPLASLKRTHEIELIQTRLFLIYFSAKKGLFMIRVISQARDQARHSHVLLLLTTGKIVI